VLKASTNRRAWITHRGHWKSCIWLGDHRKADEGRILYNNVGFNRLSEISEELTSDCEDSFRL